MRDVAPQEEGTADDPAPPFLPEGVVPGGSLAGRIVEEKLIAHDGPLGFIGMGGSLDPPAGQESILEASTVPSLRPNCQTFDVQTSRDGTVPTPAAMSAALTSKQVASLWAQAMQTGAPQPTTPTAGCGLQDSDQASISGFLGTCRWRPGPGFC